MKINDPASMAQALAQAAAAAMQSKAAQPAANSSGLAQFQQQLLALVRSLLPEATQGADSTAEPQQPVEARAEPSPSLVPQEQQMQPGTTVGVGDVAANDGVERLAADGSSGNTISPAQTALEAAIRQLVSALLNRIQGSPDTGQSGIDGTSGSGGQSQLDSAIAALVQALSNIDPGGAAGMQDPSGLDGGSDGIGSDGAGGPDTSAYDPQISDLAQALLGGSPATDGTQDGSSGLSGNDAVMQALEALVQSLLQGADGTGTDTGAGGSTEGTGGDAGIAGSGTEDPQLSELLNEVAQLMAGQAQPSEDTGSAQAIDGSGGSDLTSALQSLVQNLLDQAGTTDGASPQDQFPARPTTQSASVTTPQTQSGTAIPPTGSAGLSANAGGVAQAAATDGVSAASDKVIDTGSGSDKIENVTNNTSRTESLTYSDEDGHKATMTLKPGETQSFRSGSQELGVRISPSDAAGNTNPNEVLFEDGADLQDPSKQNPDISKVDGDKDYAGNAEDMTVTLGDGRTAGDGDPIHAYAYSTDDAASMGLAGDTSKTDNIVLSDKTA